MAQEFLGQLLRMENSVQSDESQHCYICMSEIGTLCSTSGVIECAISLPCNPQHKVGSACIAKWLKDNNTCPVCRHEFFPLPEDDTDEDDAESLSSEGDDEQYPEPSHVERARTARTSELVVTNCLALHLNDDSLIECAQLMGETASRMLSLTCRSESSIAAASVYLTSHLYHQPRSLREICRLVGSTEGATQTVYRRLYAHHHRVPASMGLEIFGYPLDHALAEGGRSSIWPPLEHEFVDGEDSQDEEFIEDLWSRLSAELQLQPAVISIARRMAYKLEAWPAVARYDARSLASISIYLASYAAGAPEYHLSIAEVSAVAGFAAPFLPRLYWEIYHDREQLLDSTMRSTDLPFAEMPFGFEPF